MGKADTLTNLLLHDIAKKYNNQCSFNSKMVSFEEKYRRNASAFLGVLTLK